MDARTLSLPISILSYKQPDTVQIGSPVSAAIDIMQKGGRGCVLVVDEANNCWESLRSAICSVTSVDNALQLQILESNR